MSKVKIVISKKVIEPSLNDTVIEPSLNNEIIAKHNNMDKTKNIFVFICHCNYFLDLK